MRDKVASSLFLSQQTSPAIETPHRVTLRAGVRHAECRGPPSSSLLLSSLELSGRTFCEPQIRARLVQVDLALSDLAPPATRDPLVQVNRLLYYFQALS